MAEDYDLVIRNGTIFDGTGGGDYRADIGIRQGRIRAVGPSLSRGADEIDAKGLIVTPGFVDIHTHYDAQVTWEPYTQPSATHGVTTAVMGNCGVGFAPCRARDRERLIGLMEGVEDIPGVVMAEGIPWQWETFEDYLDFVASQHRDIDVAAQLPHACLRIFVMGERAAEKEVASEADLIEMRQLAERAIRAGAIGFATSRSLFHKDREGGVIPTKDAGEAELLAIGAGVAAGGGGVVEALIDFDHLEPEFALLKTMSKAFGLPTSFTVAQTNAHPDAWRRALRLLEQANDEGVRMRGQIIGRPTGIILGLNLSFNPFSLTPTYQAIGALPLPQRLLEMRKSDVRAKILSEKQMPTPFIPLRKLQAFDFMYVLGDPPNYEPNVADSIAARAARAGTTPAAYVYDIMVQGDGNTILFLPSNNYTDGNLDAVLKMIRHQHTVLGLGDGGAHYGVICDAAYPTFMLTHWTRDRPGERLPLAAVVKMLSLDTAEAVGLSDRGRIAPGLKADLNVIDYDKLHLCAPSIRFDLPANGRRAVQASRGYRATIVSGAVTYRDGEATGNLPGRLVRNHSA